MGFIKGSLLFAGGVVLGGVVATKTTMIVMTEEIHKMLDDMDSYKPKRKHISYADARPDQHIDDILFETRREANKILDEMETTIANYGFVTIEDLYDLAGLPSARYTDSKYGWANINTARVVRVHDGYILKLPRATYV